MRLTALQPAQEMVLHANGEPEHVPSPRGGSAHLYATSQDLKCMHCGFVAGQLVTEQEDGSQRSILRVSGQCPSAAAVVGGRIRCCRCGGPVYLDEIEILMRLQPEVIEAPRRGRKPKDRLSA